MDWLAVCRVGCCCFSQVLDDSNKNDHEWVFLPGAKGSMLIPRSAPLIQPLPGLDRSFFRLRTLVSRMIRHLGWLGLMLAVCVPLSGCKETSTADLDFRAGVAYLKDTSNPYSGPIKDYFKKPDGSNGKLMQEGFYNRGLKHDVWTSYKWNGEKTVTKFEAGLEEGVSEEFYPEGSIKRQVGYSKGKLNGFTSDYDTKGKVGRQIYYTNGFITHPPNPRKTESKGEEGGEEAHEQTSIEEKLYGKRKKTMMDYIKEMF